MNRTVALLVVLAGVIAMAWHIEITARPETGHVGHTVQGNTAAQ